MLQPKFIETLAREKFHKKPQNKGKIFDLSFAEESWNLYVQNGFKPIPKPKRKSVDQLKESARRHFSKVFNAESARKKYLEKFKFDENRSRVSSTNKRTKFDKKFAEISWNKYVESRWNEDEQRKSWVESQIKEMTFYDIDEDPLKGKRVKEIGFEHKPWKLSPTNGNNIWDGEKWVTNK